MVIELRVMQFWSEIILVISNRMSAQITRMISDQIALHSVQLPLLIRVSILSIFVLNRVSFLVDKQPARMFYECLKQGIKNRNSVLNRVRV